MCEEILTTLIEPIAVIIGVVLLVFELYNLAKQTRIANDQKMVSIEFELLKEINETGSKIRVKCISKQQDLEENLARVFNDIDTAYTIGVKSNFSNYVWFCDKMGLLLMRYFGYFAFLFPLRSEGESPWKNFTNEEEYFQMYFENTLYPFYKNCFKFVLKSEVEAILTRQPSKSEQELKAFLLSIEKHNPSLKLNLNTKVRTILKGIPRKKKRQCNS